MANAKTLASQVHGFLLAAKPDQDDDNLAKAAKLASQARPPRGPQAETYLAIMKVKIAVATDASGVDAEGLLLVAIAAARSGLRLGASR
jgi:hypothetical protein